MSTPVLEAGRPASVEETFEGAAVDEILWRAWLPGPPGSEPSAVVVIAHGVSEHSNRYSHVAARFADGGIATYALDHQGHGRSSGTRCVLTSMDSAVADLDRLITTARRRHPGVPVFLLGHSMGGAISISYALAHQNRLDGLLLSGPLALVDAAPAPMRALASLLSRVTPALPLVGIDPEAVSTDPAIVADYEQDPLNHHGRLPVRTVAVLSDAVLTFPDRLPEITVPLLVLHGEDDRLVPVAAAELVHERAGSADKELGTYPGLAHEILNEPPWEEIADRYSAWMAARSAPRTA